MSDFAVVVRVEQSREPRRRIEFYEQLMMRENCLPKWRERFEFDSQIMVRVTLCQSLWTMCLPSSDHRDTRWRHWQTQLSAKLCAAANGERTEFASVDQKCLDPCAMERGSSIFKHFSKWYDAAENSVERQMYSDALCNLVGNRLFDPLYNVTGWRICGSSAFILQSNALMWAIANKHIDCSVRMLFNIVAQHQSDAWSGDRAILGPSTWWFSCSTNNEVDRERVRKQFVQGFVQVLAHLLAGNAGDALSLRRTRRMAARALIGSLDGTLSRTLLSVPSNFNVLRDFIVSLIAERNWSAIVLVLQTESGRFGKQFLSAMIRLLKTHCIDRIRFCDFLKQLRDDDVSTTDSVYLVRFLMTRVGTQSWFAPWHLRDDSEYARATFALLSERYGEEIVQLFLDAYLIPTLGASGWIDKDKSSAKRKDCKSRREWCGLVSEKRRRVVDVESTDQ